jgi:hypothetical protein
MRWWWDYVLCGALVEAVVVLAACHEISTRDDEEGNDREEPQVPVTCRVCARARACVCVCVCVRARARVCVCVCVRARALMRKHA